MQICSSLRFSWSILVKCCIHFRTSSSKNSNHSSREVYIPQILTVLLDSLRLYLTFAAFRFLMSVIRKQWLEQYNYSDVQSALMTRFQTDFTSSVWNRRRPSSRNVPQRRWARRNVCVRRLSFLKQTEAIWGYPNLTSERNILPNKARGTAIAKYVFLELLSLDPPFRAPTVGLFPGLYSVVWVGTLLFVPSYANSRLKGSQQLET